MAVFDVVFGLDHHTVAFPKPQSKDAEDPTDAFCVSQIRLIADISVLEDVTKKSTFISKQRKSSISPKYLSEKWQIGAQQAKNTLRVTYTFNCVILLPHT